MATIFSGGRSWSTRREPQTMAKQLYLAAASRVHPFCNLQSRAQTHTVLVIFKSGNYSKYSFNLSLL
jgi:hypothetical protein